MNDIREVVVAVVTLMGWFSFFVTAHRIASGEVKSTASVIFLVIFLFIGMAGVLPNRDE